MSTFALTNQGTPPLTDTTELEQRVARMALPVRPLATGYYRLSGDCAEDLLVTLLAEVDETILPRRIKLVTDTDQTVYLFVKDRRLMRVAQPHRQGVPPTSKTVQAGDMIARLQEILTGATKAILQSSRNMAGCPTDTGGCTLSMLLDVLGGAEKADPVLGFFSALSAQTKAWITLDPAGNFLEQGGDPTMVGGLRTLANDGLAGFDEQLVQTMANPEQPGCIVLDTGTRDGNMLVYARSQSSGFVAVLPHSELPDLLPLWRVHFC
jgi:hypothetical protein